LAKERENKISNEIENRKQGVTVKHDDGWCLRAGVLVGKKFGDERLVLRVAAQRLQLELHVDDLLLRAAAARQQRAASKPLERTRVQRFLRLALGLGTL
jgi:hypothetical protein